MECEENGGKNSERNRIRATIGPNRANESAEMSFVLKFFSVRSEVGKISERNRIRATIGPNRANESAGMTFVLKFFSVRSKVGKISERNHFRATIGPNRANVNAYMNFVLISVGELEKFQNEIGFGGRLAEIHPIAAQRRFRSEIFPTLSSPSIYKSLTAV